MKKIIGSDLAAGGVNGRTQGQHGAGVAGRRVVVGDRATQGAHGAHLTVANVGSQISQRRDGGFELSVVGHVDVARHGADDKGIAFAADADQLFDATQVCQLLGAGQAQLHGGE